MTLIIDENIDRIVADAMTKVPEIRGAVNLMSDDLRLIIAHAVNEAMDYGYRKGFHQAAAWVES